MGCFFGFWRCRLQLPSETVKVTFSNLAVAGKDLQLDSQNPQAAPALLHKEPFTCLFSEARLNTKNPQTKGAIIASVVVYALSVMLIGLSCRCCRAPVGLFIQGLLIMEVSLVQIASRSTLHIRGPLTILRPSMKPIR